MPPAEAQQRIEEILTKVVQIPSTRTTGTHFANYHLSIVESAILGLQAESSPAGKQDQVGSGADRPR